MPCAAALQLLDEAALYEQYTRVISTEPSLNEETEDVCALLKVDPLPFQCGQIDAYSMIPKSKSQLQLRNPAMLIPRLLQWRTIALLQCLLCDVLSPQSGVQECMDLRLKWLFRPALSPAQMGRARGVLPLGAVHGRPLQVGRRRPQGPGEGCKAFESSSYTSSRF